MQSRHGGQFVSRHHHVPCFLTVSSQLNFGLHIGNSNQKPDPCARLRFHRFYCYPLVIQQFAIEHGPVEIADLPIRNGDLPIKNGDLPMKNGDFPSEIVIFHRFWSTFWTGLPSKPLVPGRERPDLLGGSRGCLEQHVTGDMAGESETIDFPMENHCL